MNRYVYVQAGYVGQTYRQDVNEACVSFRHIIVSAYSEEGAYIEGQKHQFDDFDESTAPFQVLNDYVIPLA